MAKSRKTHISTWHNTGETHDLSWSGVFLSVFLPDSNGRSCSSHPFGCGNSMVLNRDDLGVGMHLRLRCFVRHELACYTIDENGSDGCRVCFTAREYAAGDNDLRLDGATVKITEVFTAEHVNCMMQHLFFHNCGYAYAVVVSYAD